MATAEDKVNVLGIVTVGVVSALLLWVAVVALQAYYENSFGAEQARKNALNKSAAYRTVKAEQAADLDEYAWVDRKTGIVRLPIEHAMELVVHDLQAGAPSLVPAVGAHDVATAPAQFQKVVTTGQAPAGASDEAAAPEGAEATGATGESATPQAATENAAADPGEANDGASAGEAQKPATPGEAEKPATGAPATE